MWGIVLRHRTRTLAGVVGGAHRGAAERNRPFEVDLLGRVCDDAFIVLKELLEPDADLSTLRSMTEAEREQEIKRFLQALPGAAIA